MKRLTANQRMRAGKLKHEAEKAMLARGHKFDTWQDYLVSCHFATIQCTRCACSATINIKPLPNEIAVGGSALALNCGD